MYYLKTIFRNYTLYSSIAACIKWQKTYFINLICTIRKRFQLYVKIPTIDFCINIIGQTVRQSARYKCRAKIQKKMFKSTLLIATMLFRAANAVLVRRLTKYTKRESIVCSYLLYLFWSKTSQNIWKLYSHVLLSTIVII